ncbi:MAG: signal recognition particle-docking protein FtsY [Deltaproteobacteria bacterium]|nr:signal recognition particle-docking protein FtsY [Deltaproteobacteria bacterium]
MMSIEIFFALFALVLTIAVGFVLWKLKKSMQVPPASRPSTFQLEVPIEEIETASTKRFAKALTSWIPLLKSKSKDKQKWEEVLIGSDMGPRLTSELIKQIDSEENPELYLKNRLENILQGSERSSDSWKTKKPWVIFIVGVNGVGKTTTIVKLAHYFKKQSLKVGVVGADTFRKAAVEQLERGCQRIDIPFFTLKGAENSEGADPSAVVFDGLKKFQAMDIILVDTSGRLHNKKNLMEELLKMKRVSAKSLEGSPHDIWMVIDATLGQNAVQQGRSFHETLGLTGLVATKMDGLSRGGTLFQVYHELKIPIIFMGFGEKESDLEEFRAKNFVEELFDLKAPNS